MLHLHFVVFFAFCSMISHGENTTGPSRNRYARKTAESFFDLKSEPIKLKLKPDPVWIAGKQVYPIHERISIGPNLFKTGLSTVIRKVATRPVGCDLNIGSDLRKRAAEDSDIHINKKQTVTSQYHHISINDHPKPVGRKVEISGTPLMPQTTSAFNQVNRQDSRIDREQPTEPDNDTGNSRKFQKDLDELESSTQPFENPSIERNLNTSNIPEGVTDSDSDSELGFGKVFKATSSKLSENIIPVPKESKSEARKPVTGSMPIHNPKAGKTIPSVPFQSQEAGKSTPSLSYQNQPAGKTLPFNIPSESDDESESLFGDESPDLNSKGNAGDVDYSVVSPFTASATVIRKEPEPAPIAVISDDSDSDSDVNLWKAVQEDNTAVNPENNAMYRYEKREQKEAEKAAQRLRMEPSQTRDAALSRGSLWQIGQTIPELVLLNEQGKPIHIDKITKSRGLVIFIFLKAAMSGCQYHACLFKEKYYDFLESGFQVMGLSVDRPPELKAFKFKAKLNFELLSDPDMKLITAIGAIKDSRIIRSHIIIDEGSVLLKIEKEVLPKTSAKRALEFVEELE
jgi:peroxiredoxin Q/BCP